MQIEAFEPAIGAIIYRQPQYGHIVRIHHTVDETDTHPVRDEHTSAAANLLEPLRINLGGRMRGRQFRKMFAYHEIGESSEKLWLFLRGEYLKIAKAQERRRDPADNGARFRLRMHVVKHISYHRFPCR